MGDRVGGEARAPAEGEEEEEGTVAWMPPSKQLAELLLLPKAGEYIGDKATASAIVVGGREGCKCACAGDSTCDVDDDDGCVLLGGGSLSLSLYRRLRTRTPLFLLLLLLLLL